MKAKIDPRDQAAAILGPGAEIEMTFLLVPMSTYMIVAEQAAKEHTTAATVFGKAIMQYIQNANEPVVQIEVPKKAPDIVVRRRRT